MIPVGTMVEDINPNVDDFMLLSWDVNQRTPRFFSKWAKETIKNDPEQDYDMSFDDMVTASGSDIYYFHPFVKNDNLYISGDNLAQVPAMFSVFAAMEQK